MPCNIAIDGPAGAGKSTIAKALAARLGFIYVDTGALYRTMALHLIRQGIGPEEEERIGAECKNIRISIRYENGVQLVSLNGQDVSGELRAEQVGNTASVISAYPAVRERLLDLQRQLARDNDVVMDGRDIGTCILPEADVKVYLTASSAIRAMRRLKELAEKGLTSNLEEIEQDIIERDQRDMNRSQAPLKKASDAVLIDSSDMSLSQVLDQMAALVKEKADR